MPGRHRVPRSRRRKPREDPRGPTLALVAEGFLSRLSMGLVSLALPLYALHLGMSLGAIGFLVSVNVVVQLVAKPLLAPVADRIGHRRALILAICGRSAVCLLFAVAQTPAQLFAVRLVYGLTQALRDPPLMAAIASAGGSSRVASTFAWYHTAKNLAAALGRAAAGALLALSAGGFQVVFLVAFTVSLLPVGVVARFLRIPASAPETASTPLEEQDGEGTRPGSLTRRQLLPLTGLGFLFGTTAGMLNLFPAIAQRYLGLGPAQIGTIMLASTVVVLVAGPLFGYLSDHVSRSLVLLVRGAANILSSVMYLVLPGPWGAGTARLTDDAGKAAFRPAWGSVMAEVAHREPRRRAVIMSWVDVGEDAGDAVGPALAGVLLTAGGLPLMLGVRCALAALTEAWAWKVTHRLPTPDPMTRGSLTPERTPPGPLPGAQLG